MGVFMNGCVAIAVDTMTQTSDLAGFLAREVEQSSLRVVAAKTGVSKTAIDNIVKGKNVELPQLETLEKIATAYNLPLWRVVEMIGIDVGLPDTPDSLARRLTALSGHLPEIEPIVDYLLRLHPDDLRGVVL